jgi:ethanolamine utilization protein EutN
MLHALVIGHATSTIKHPSMDGWKLAIVQPLGSTGQPDGDPQVVVDALGAGVGQYVVINSDGKFARETVGHEKSPIRYVLCGIVDRK